MSKQRLLGEDECEVLVSPYEDLILLNEWYWVDTEGTDIDEIGSTCSVLSLLLGIWGKVEGKFGNQCGIGNMVEEAANDLFYTGWLKVFLWTKI